MIDHEGFRNLNLEIKILIRDEVFYVPLAFNPIALRKTKFAYDFGLSECNRVKLCTVPFIGFNWRQLSLCDDHQHCP